VEMTRWTSTISVCLDIGRKQAMTKKRSAIVALVPYCPNTKPSLRLIVQSQIAFLDELIQNSSKQIKIPMLFKSLVLSTALVLDTASVQGFSNYVSRLASGSRNPPTWGAGMLQQTLWYFELPVLSNNAKWPGYNQCK